MNPNMHRQSSATAVLPMPVQVCREWLTAKLHNSPRLAEVLGVQKDAVLVASTGVIGMQLKMDRIEARIDMLAPALDGSIEAGHLAAKAIMTTDTVPKEVAVTFEIGGKKVTMGGMCKGSGMIHPNMCTMLGFITTDANISKALLQEALSEDIKDIQYGSVYVIHH